MENVTDEVLEEIRTTSVSQSVNGLLEKYLDE